MVEIDVENWPKNGNIVESCLTCHKSQIILWIKNAENGAEVSTNRPTSMLKLQKIEGLFVYSLLISGSILLLTILLLSLNHCLTKYFILKLLQPCSKNKKTTSQNFY